MTRHRRRAIGWVLVAGVLGLIAIVRGGGSPAAPAQPLAQVVVAARALPAGAPIRAADVILRRVPAAGLSTHEVTDPAAVVGRRPAVGLPAGSPIMDAELATASAPPDARDVAIRLDDLAGAPSEDMAGGRADLYLTRSGRAGPIQRVLSGVLVVSATHSADGSVATLRLPPGMVGRAISAERAGQLRLVAVTPGSRG
ncbi:MAG: Flp pilus assembly protein CpaB [Gaiellales bacterium]